MTHIIVARTHPAQYYGVRFLLLLILLALLWGAYEMGYLQSEEDIIEAKGGRHSLIAQQKVLKKKNKELSKELLHLERKYILEQEAGQIIKSTISRDQNKIAELEKKLAFYKGIVSPAKDKQSLYLQNFEIKPQQLINKQNQYQYQFVIAQKVKKSTYTKGSVTIFINGILDNKTVKLSMISLIADADLTAKKEKSFKYNFKYFQEFSGIISLPEGMTPQSVDIIIDSKMKKSIIELNDLAWSETEGMKYVGK